MRRVFAIVTSALLASGSLHAETFAVPGDNPVATVSIPDSWTPKRSGGGVEASSADGEVRLSVEFAAAADREAAGAAGVRRLTDRGVEVDANAKRTREFRINGLDAFEIDYSGKERKGETDVALILVAPHAPSQYLLISYWGEDEAQESNGNDLLSILDSVRATK